jgi:hypothetical protein
VAPALVGDVEPRRGIEAARRGAVLAHDAAQHRGGVGLDAPLPNLRLDDVQHLLGDLGRQVANLGGDIGVLPLGELGRVAQRLRPVVIAFLANYHLLLVRHLLEVPVVAALVFDLFVLIATSTLSDSCI